MSNEYILVKRGGTEPGKRPRTMLARVVSYSGERQEYRVHIKRRKGETKNVVKIARSDVIGYFDGEPDAKLLREFRSQLARSI